MVGVSFVLVWVLIVFSVCFLLFVVHAMSMFMRLYFLLLGTVWRSFEECLALGYGKKFTGIALEVIYDQDDLDVRLSDHSRECKNCYSNICKQLISDELLEAVEPLPQKDYVVHLFEQECFSSDTAFMFELRLGSH